MSENTPGVTVSMGLTVVITIPVPVQYINMLHVF